MDGGGFRWRLRWWKNRAVAVKRTSARRECSNSFKHLPPNAVPPPAATSGGVLASGLAAPRARRSGTVARGGATGGCGGPRPRRARLQRGSCGGVLACARGSRAPVAMSAAAGGKAQGGGRERQSGDYAEAEDEEVAGRVVEKKEARGIGTHLLVRADSDPAWSDDHASKSDKYVLIFSL